MDRKKSTLLLTAASRREWLFRVIEPGSHCQVQRHRQGCWHVSRAYSDMADPDYNSMRPNGWASELLVHSHEQELLVTTLMSAVRSNNSALVQQLIQNGSNVDELDANLDAPLIIAAYKGYTKIVQLLLVAGADVAAVDPGMKATALHAAAYAGNTEAAKLLLQYHVDINKQGPNNGYTALHDAIWQGHLETARVLLDAGASLTVQSHLGETPLMFAKAKHHEAIVNLIEHKVIANRGV